VIGRSRGVETGAKRSPVVLRFTCYARESDTYLEFEKGNSRIQVSVHNMRIETIMLAFCNSLREILHSRRLHSQYLFTYTTRGSKVTSLCKARCPNFRHLRHLLSEKCQFHHGTAGWHKTCISRGGSSYKLLAQGKAIV
jgi:hypothetical protein